MYKKKSQRLINAYDLEKYAVIHADGNKYIPWLAIAEVPTAHLTAQRCPFCGAMINGGSDGKEKS